MTTSFNQEENQEEAKAEGSQFNLKDSDDNQNPKGDGVTTSITEEELKALQKRDEHAQTHITTLEDEAKVLKDQITEMQTKLDKAKDVEDLLENQGKQQVNVEEITTGVIEQLNAKELKAQQDENFNTVSTALTEKFGDKVDEEVKKAASENGLTFDEMVEMSRKNPKLALKLLDVKVKATPKPQQGSLNTSAFIETQQGVNPPTKNVLELSSDKERVNDFQARLEAKVREMNN